MGNCLRSPDFASSVDVCCDDNTATQICIDLRKQGLAQVNPTYPKLQKAVALGATSQMFCDAYNELKMQKRNIAKPFPYLVSTVINRINETHSISIPVNNNNANQRPKFTQQQKSDIVASMIIKWRVRNIGQDMRICNCGINIGYGHLIIRFQQKKHHIHTGSNIHTV